MKLLLDANLSPLLAGRLADLYPGSTHVFEHGSIVAVDAAIWKLAEAEGFAIVTKDTDFLELSLLRGAPPKVVLLRIGNTPDVHSRSPVEASRCSPASVCGRSGRSRVDDRKLTADVLVAPRQSPRRLDATAPPFPGLRRCRG